jgi:hypothetical protein
VVDRAFSKFPRTPHLFSLSRHVPRDDKLVEPELARELLTRPATAEEKIDGSNLGISVDPNGRLRVQSRGSFVEPTSHPQYRLLGPWLGTRATSLRDALDDALVLFGEWCYARHTVAYDTLPDWFLAFDVLDRNTERFWSRARRDALCARLGVATAPVLADAVIGRTAIEGLLGTSRIGSAPMEGIYLRWDEGDWLAHRAKVVRAQWVPADEEHWKARTLEPNRLAGSKAPATRTGGPKRIGGRS